MNTKSKSKKQGSPNSWNNNSQTLLKLTLLGLVALTRTARTEEGGTMVAPTPAFSVTPAALQPLQPSEMDVFAAPTVSQSQPFELGPLILRPHPFYRFLYGDGIQAATNQVLTTSIQTVSPGLQVDIGRHWSLDYTPTWTLYSDHHFRDTFDQAVKLAWGTTYEDWILGASQSYATTSTPLIETGTQTDQENYSTAINLSYLINTKMSLDLAFNQDINSAAQLQSTRQWSTLDWVNYQFWPRLSAALGAGFGYVDVETGANMTYEQFQGRVGWRATDKVSFQIHGGLEDRQFLVSGASDALNPVAGAMIQYQPFEYTKLSLNADQTVATSLLTGTGTQITENSSIQANINQRLWEHWYLNMGGGYNTTKYTAATGAATSRQDDYYSFNVRLSTTFLKRGTIAAFYQISDNSSDQSGFTYSSHQVGLELGFRY